MVGEQVFTDKELTKERMLMSIFQGELAESNDFCFKQMISTQIIEIRIMGN